MKIRRSIYLLLTILSILSSCSEKKQPPLKGERINVLHFDVLKDRISHDRHVVLPSPFLNSEWPSSDDGQVNFTADNLQLSSNLKPFKSFSLSKFSPKSQDSAIMIIDNMIYSYARGILAANNLEKNKLLWSAEVVNPRERTSILNGSMLYNNGIIYLTTGTKDLVAYNAKDGKELWRYTAPNVVRYIPYIYKNMLFINTIDNIIYCLNTDGKLLWRHDAPSYSIASHNVYSPNLIFNNQVFTLTTAGDLVILNKIDGEELIEVNLANTSIIGDGSLAKGPLNSPHLEDHFLYILTGESELIKVDLSIPGIAWRQNLPGAISTWITKQTSFILMDNNQLLALDNKDAKIIWSIDLPRKDPKKTADFYGPILAGGNLYLITSKGDLFSFSAKDGKLVNKYKTIETNIAPIIVKGKLFVIGNSGKISIWQ